MPPKNIICKNCEYHSESKTSFCAECGAEYPWKKEPMYQFDEESLPYVFSYSVSSTNWNMWNEFCLDYFGEDDIDARDIADFSVKKFPKMESFDTELYFVLTESYEIEGPFVDEPRMFTAHGHSIMIEDDN